MIYIYFIAQGKIEWMIWHKKYGVISNNFIGKYLDYHSLRVIESIAIGFGVLSSDLSWYLVIAHSSIANTLYEMVLKGKYDIRTNKKTFNVFGKDIWYRWWTFYLIPPIIGSIIIIIDLIL
jgi:hypothetical protein